MFGEVAEWPKAPVWNAGIPQGIVGSNPTLSISFCLLKAFAPTGQRSDMTLLT